MFVPHPSCHLTALAVFTAAMMASAAEAAIINVPSGPAPTIQAAINIAINGDEILVAPGTYFQVLNLNGKTLTLRSVEGPQTTIIDALNLDDPVIKITSGEGAATLIEGFTLRNGVANDAAPNERGGGIYCNLTSPTISNCIFSQNNAVAGGAFYANGGFPKLENCQFNGNTSGGSGGGAMYLNNTTFTVNNCVFDSNNSGFNGGAIYAVNTAVTATQCAFIDNTSAGHGGGVGHLGATGATLYDRCLFQLNTSGDLGGGAFTSTNSGIPEWRNCIFDRNHGVGNGGGMSIWDNSNVIALNCTFSGNTTDGGGGGGGIYTEGTATTNARNCVAWGNSSGFNSATTAAYCNVQNVMAGSDNISLDPMFIDAANGILAFQEGSPCIDAGSSVLVPATVAVDYGGLPRVINVLESGASGLPVFGYYVDMGAFEFQSEPVDPPDTCPADVAPPEGDNLVNVTDLLSVISAWGACPK